MNTDELQHYLHAHIPLSAAMQVRVVAASLESVTLDAPLAPNINHRETVFGGSASALAILSAWSLLHLRLEAERSGARLVIQHNTMDYDLPIDGAFSATSVLDPRVDWSLFVRTLARRGRARAAALATLESAGTRAGRFRGEFVAFAPRVKSVA